MKHISKFITNHSVLIVIIAILLMIPSVIGYFNTRINYDILVYLPEDNETIQGQNILTQDFGLGSYAFVMVDNMSNKQILKLEKEIQEIEGIDKVLSIADVIGTTIPKEMLPDAVLDKIYNKNETIMVVTFSTSTSDDTTINSFIKLREMVDDASKVSGMTGLVVDTADLSNSEMLIYIGIAVILCIVILALATDSYLIPFLLLGNIGIAILYNLGSNILLGQISYITQAITAVLQLGVTTDFSIFLYHKYEDAKKHIDNKEAMTLAITETFKSVLGSSLTTIAGFLALCTMDLTLGTDIGIVMAKGVLCGLICVLTIFPAMLLVFDKWIEKTKHKVLLPKFKILQNISLNKYKIIIVIFLILLVPAVLGYTNYKVYYKLDDSLPADLPFNKSNEELKEKFGITAPQIILLDKNIKADEVDEIIDKLKDVEGIDLVAGTKQILELGIPTEMFSEDIKDILSNEKYQLILINSEYEIASDELNRQLVEVQDVVKAHDETAIVAGEGALMKDLISIADHDFNMVTYTSLAIIFVIMIIVLQSISLPIILIFTIEFAIFANMAVAYFTNTTLPFIAPIVVGTIQLGATIDYAILMSNKYLSERKEKSNKKEAMRRTLIATVPSIITSGLCFFAATFGVGIYTKIDMIGSICTLLSRGAIISMLVVILLLPALLMIFDKLIMKTTKIAK